MSASCSRCGGFIYKDRDMDEGCLNCGWYSYPPVADGDRREGTRRLPSSRSLSRETALRIGRELGFLP